jgi:hypothetical protein
MLEQWNTRLIEELGIELNFDTAQILSLAADAAHNVVRPSAPLTTFLVGYAAALQGGDKSAIDTAVEKARALALGWQPE